MAFRFGWLRGIRRQPPVSIVPPNWQHAVDGTVEHLARRYNLAVVERDLQGDGKRYPSFKIEFFKELIKRL